jgi:hypothetical protein
VRVAGAPPGRGREDRRRTRRHRPLRQGPARLDQRTAHPLRPPQLRLPRRTAPPARPYWQWTRKIAARTICRWLSADQHGDYTPWIDNDRRLRELLARLEALGTAAFEADPRWKR